MATTIVKPAVRPFEGEEDGSTRIKRVLERAGVAEPTISKVNSFLNNLRGASLFRPTRQPPIGSVLFLAPKLYAGRVDALGLALRVQGATPISWGCSRAAGIGFDDAIGLAYDGARATRNGNGSDPILECALDAANIVRERVKRIVAEDLPDENRWQCSLTTLINASSALLDGYGVAAAFEGSPRNTLLLYCVGDQPQGQEAKEGIHIVDEAAAKRAYSLIRKFD